MSDQEFKIRCLKEKLLAEQRTNHQTRNYLLKYHPEIFTEVHNHLQDKIQERINRVMKRIGAMMFGKDKK
jgi:hypothetical protein